VGPHASSPKIPSGPVVLRGSVLGPARVAVRALGAPTSQSHRSPIAYPIEGSVALPAFVAEAPQPALSLSRRAALLRLLISAVAGVAAPHRDDHALVTRQPPAHYRLLVLLCEKYVMPSCGRRSSLAQVAAKARTNRPSVPAASNAHSDSCMHAMRDLSGGRPQYVHPVTTNHKSEIVWRQRDTERHKKGRCSGTTETKPMHVQQGTPFVFADAGR